MANKQQRRPGQMIIRLRSEEIGSLALVAGERVAVEADITRFIKFLGNETAEMKRFEQQARPFLESIGQAGDEARPMQNYLGDLIIHSPVWLRDLLHALSAFAGQPNILALLTGNPQSKAVRLAQTLQIQGLTPAVIWSLMYDCEDVEVSPVDFRVQLEDFLRA